MTEPANLQGIHDGIYLGDRRAPLTKVLLFDQTDTLSDTVLGRQTQVSLDITACVLQWSISQSEDEATTASLTVVPDPLVANPLTPYHFVGRRIIQIFYADAATYNEFGTDYMPLFTGVVVGQPGYKRSRENKEKTIEIRCVDRSFFYNKRKLNSPDFPQGTDLGDVAITIATDTNYGMGLEREECKFGLLRETVAHTKIALFDVSYMEGLTYLGFLSDLQPTWDGGGFLVMRDVSISKSPVRLYDDESLFVDIDWPQSSVDLNNRVKIVGLAAETTLVVSPFQELATIRGTIGYFEVQYKTRVYFSEDRQARAQGVRIVAWSMNGQLGSFIGSTKPKLQSITEFSCVLVIDTPYMPWVFVVFFTVYIAFFTISAIFGGLVEKIAMVAAATWLCAGLLVMQQLGTFEVTIGGEPYKLVYKEIEGVAQWANLQPYEVREEIIENHLVSTQAQANQLAYRELVREKIHTMQRNLTLPLDPLLQPTDVIELPDASRYYISSISRSYKRNEGPQNMQVSAYLIRSGPEYAGNTGFTEY